MRVLVNVIVMVFSLALAITFMMTFTYLLFVASFGLRWAWIGLGVLTAILSYLIYKQLRRG